MDELKHIDDTYGHADGDLAIISLASALKASVKEGELCARFGGDEFMAVYTTQNEKYLSKAFLLVADDDVRDYGSVEKGAEKAEKWRSKGWEVISMKNDWTTIYGGNVVKTSK